MIAVIEKARSVRTGRFNGFERTNETFRQTVNFLKEIFKQSKDHTFVSKEIQCLHSHLTHPPVHYCPENYKAKDKKRAY